MLKVLKQCFKLKLDYYSQRKRIRNKLQPFKKLYHQNRINQDQINMIQNNKKEERFLFQRLLKINNLKLRKIKKVKKINQVNPVSLINQVYQVNQNNKVSKAKKS